MITRELVNGKVPYKGMTLNEMIEKIGKDQSHKLPITKNYPGKLFNSLIERCLSRDPTKRPTFTELVSKISDLHKKWARDHGSKA
jgi:serine/threonine protein kinase